MNLPSRLFFRLRLLAAVIILSLATRMSSKQIAAIEPLIRESFLKSVLREYLGDDSLTKIGGGELLCAYNEFRAV